MGTIERLGRKGQAAVLLIALVLGALAPSVLFDTDTDLVTDGEESARNLLEPSPGRLVGGPDPALDTVSRDVLTPSGRNDADPNSAREAVGPPESTTTAPPPTTAAEAAAAASAPSTTRASATTRAPATSSPATNPPATTSAPATTASPTTTGSPDAPQVLAFSTFTDWPIRNTSLDARTQFISTPASQIGVNQFTEPSDRAIALGSVTENKHLGQFRTQCSFSHFAYDDPIVFPGQPGAAHLHMFFGNTHANAKSSYTSLRDSGSSTCNGLEGNRTAYWVPAVFDASGSARIPSRIEVYYKSHDRAFDIVEKPPEGLAMVTPQAASTPHVEWACQETGAQGTNLNRPVQQRQNTIPRCSGTSTLLAHIKFPQCLSGSVGPNSGNDTNKMSYPTNGYFTNSCRGGSTYLTSIEYFIAWNPDNHDGRTNEWWLSSDVRADGSLAPNGSTLHGDWFGAWNPALMDQIHENCIARLAECSWDLIDDNRRLTWVEHFGPKNPEAYAGRRAVAASELSSALCPGDHYETPLDAAGCGHH
ncbi:MAG: DUF1996 domain-containing protein [Acidimicrobiales bacterium]